MASLHFLLFALLCALTQGSVVITYDTSTTCTGPLIRTFSINPGNCVTLPPNYLAASAEIADHRPSTLRLRVWTWQGANLCAVPDGTGASWGSCVTTTYQNRVITGISLFVAPNNLANPEDASPHDQIDSVYASTPATPLTYGYVDGQVVYEVLAESLPGQEYAKLQSTQDKISFLKKHGDKHEYIGSLKVGEASQIELK